MDPSKRIPHDDWVDQDLLTRGEAAQRLTEEIEVVSAEVKAGNGDGIKLRRLAALREAHAAMTARDD